MRNLFLIFLLVLASCGYTSKQKKTEIVGHKKLIAVFTFKGQKQLGVLDLFIRDRVKIDSVTGAKFIVTDSTWVKVESMVVFDTTKVPKVALKSVSGKDSVYTYGLQVHGDSVSTRVENIDVDSLLKK